MLAKPLKSYKVEVDDQRGDHNLESTPGEMNSESPEVVEPMDRLNREIQQHRLQLPSEHCREFDGTVNNFLKLYLSLNNRVVSLFNYYLPFSAMGI